MLNQNSPIPLYRQLADILIEDIRSGKWNPGDKIPSEPVMVRTYHIGRPTVRQALDFLLRQGLIIKRKGSGAFVANKPAEVDLFSLSGTSEAFLTAGIDINRKILDTPHFLELKNLPDHPLNGQKVFYFRRVDFAGQDPVMVEDFYLSAGLFPGIDKLDLEKDSLSRILKEKYYCIPSGGKQILRAVLPEDEIAGLLGITENTPILSIQRTIHFPHQDNAVFSEIFCRTDRYEFSQKLNTHKINEGYI